MTPNKKKVRINVDGSWYEITPEHFKALDSSEFAKIKSVEITEYLTRDEYKDLLKSYDPT